MQGKLYITGTPIGNLEDITLRQLRILEEVDCICAEDTRVTRKLLTHFEIKTPLISYHQHSSREVGEEIIRRIEQGECFAIVTDAGMPCISDPGENLVKLCYSHGIKVESVPGPTALTTALALSGVNSTRFSFYGFLPMEKKERAKRLAEIVEDTKCLVLYEAPHKLKKTLSDLRVSLCEDSRRIYLCRELTKLHEEVVAMDLADSIAYTQEHEPRGEYVLILEPKAVSEDTVYSIEDAVVRMQELIAKGESPTKAAKLAGRETGFAKNDIYQRVHGFTKEE